MKKQEFEWLTMDICKEYIRRAGELNPNGGQDTGSWRTLRIELQKRCNIPEIQAINILRGNHVKEYVHYYDILSGRIPMPEVMKKSLEEARKRKEKQEQKEGKLQSVLSPELRAELERKIDYLESLTGIEIDEFGYEENDREDDQ